MCNMKKLFFSLALCSIVLACQDDVRIPTDEKGKITALRVGFSESDNSRVTLNGISSAFEEGDAIGVFGEYMENAKFVVGSDLSNAESEEAYIVKTGEKLFSYYPYIDGVTKNYTSITGIKVRTFPIEVPKQQTQTDAAGTHVAQYDYMVGIPVVEKGENTQILFNRMNSWLDFKIYNNEEESITVKSVTIESEQKKLIYKGTVDILAQEGSSYMTVSPSSETDKLKVVTEGDWCTIVPGEYALVRASILPSDGSLGLIITVETDKGVSRMRYKGMDFKPGNIYTMTMFENSSEYGSSNVK